MRFDVPQKVMFVFGVLIAAFGLLGLMQPNWLPGLLFFPPAAAQGTYTAVFIRAASEASLAMGIYYILAARHNDRNFFRWSGPVRLVNAIVFSAMVFSGAAPTGWLIVAALELAGALSIRHALRVVTP